MFDSADERPHVDPTGSEAEDAYESWIFMARFDSEEMAVAVELVWRRGRGESWYVATLRRAGHAVVAVLDDAVVLPTLNPSMEFRAEGLWAAHICEAPFEHWTIGLEAFGVGLEDPSDLVGPAWGERTGLGFDLEWEATAEVEAISGTEYVVAAEVSGEILVGHEQFPAVVGNGAWRHSWGVGRWPTARDWKTDFVRAHLLGPHG